MIRLAPWDVVASPLATTSDDAPGAWAASRLPSAAWASGSRCGRLAIAAEFGALVPVIFPGEERVEAVQVVYRLIGGSFAACGLIAWRRRPDSRSGLLMAAAGVGFFVSAHHQPVPPADRADRGDRAAGALGALLRGAAADAPDRRTARVARRLAARGRASCWRCGSCSSSGCCSTSRTATCWPSSRTPTSPTRSTRPSARWPASPASPSRSSSPLRWRAASRPRRRALLPSVAGSAALLLFAALLTNDLVTGSRSQVVLWAGDLLARQRAGGLPRRAAALAAGPRRPRRPLPRPQHDARRRPAGGAGQDARRPGPRGGLSAARSRWATPTPTAARCWCPRSPPTAPPPRSRATAREIATLVYDASLDDDPELVDAVRAAAGIALENERLHAEAQARLAEVQASRERIVAAGDAERRRLERNLHDGAQQRLVALSLQLRLLQGRIRRDDPSRAGSSSSTASEQLAQSLEELRELARGIHPAVLDHGLAAALDSLAARSHGADHGLLRGRAAACPSRSSSPPTSWPPRRWPTSPSTRRRPRSPCASRTRAASAIIEIADDGVGGADEAGGSGLRGLADRVEALDGRLRVVSPAGRRDHRHGGAAVRVVIADDSILVREGIAALLTRAGVEVVAQADSPEELLRAIDAHRPRRGHRRRAHAAHADRRRAARGPRDPRAPPADRHRHPLPARRGRDRDAPAGRDPRAPRLSAQGPRRQRRGLRRRAAPRRRRRLGAGPRGGDRAVRARRARTGRCRP